MYLLEEFTIRPYTLFDKVNLLLHLEFFFFYVSSIFNVHFRQSPRRHFTEKYDVSNSSLVHNSSNNYTALDQAFHLLPNACCMYCSNKYQVID